MSSKATRRTASVARRPGPPSEPLAQALELAAVRPHDYSIARASA